jgi:hypothetical protein
MGTVDASKHLARTPQMMGVSPPSGGAQAESDSDPEGDQDGEDDEIHL